MSKTKRKKSSDMIICGEKISLGQRKKLELFIGRTYDFVDMSIPLEVVRGAKPGPCLFVSAAVHGDEINGTEIIRRVLKSTSIKNIRGTFIGVPIVNVFGFNHKSRYLPDGRDLNRCFPGSAKGALASRMARLFLNEVVKKSTHGIDLHTGSGYRENLPQIRACLDDPETKKLARDFGSHIVIDSALRDGSLREAARRLGIPMLLYEAGRSLHFDKKSIDIGVKGVLSVMRSIGMLPKKTSSVKRPPISKSTQWLRAPQSGILRYQKKLGDWVKKGEVVGLLADPFGDNQVKVESPTSGLIIGANNLPLANRGDALFHIACSSGSAPIKKSDLMDIEL